MKILYICTFYHRALLFSQQMNNLIKRKHKVTVLNVTEYGDKVKPKFKNIMKNKNVIHVECWNNKERLLFFPREYKIKKQLEKNTDVNKFDLIHSHILFAGGYTALKMKKKYGTKYVISVRSCDLNKFLKLKPFQKLMLKILKESSGILFLSECHKNYYFNRYVPKKEKNNLLNKTSVIGNCIEKYWEHNTKTKQKKRKTKVINILSVSKIRAIKNLTVAAKTIEILNDMGYNAKLTIVGEVIEKEELNKLKEYKNVTILNFVTKEELKEIYGKNDILLLPSISETFGRVYVEAMSQGLPILYTKGQGFDGVFKDGEVGYSVFPDDHVYIAQKVLDILKNYEDISKRCVKNCKVFYEDNIMNKIEKFYIDSINR